MLNSLDFFHLFFNGFLKIRAQNSCMRCRWFSRHCIAASLFRAETISHASFKVAKWLLDGVVRAARFLACSAVLATNVK